MGVMNAGNSQFNEIFDVKDLIGDPGCRWAMAMLNGTLAKRAQGIQGSVYEDMVKNASNPYPILVPLGTSYTMLQVSIDGKHVDLITGKNSGLQYGEKNFLAALTYVATEMLRRGCYRVDPVMKQFGKYYKKIAKKVPERYLVTVDGEFLPFDHDTIADFLGMCLRETRMIFHNMGAMCGGCPFRKVCRYPANRDIVSRMRLTGMMDMDRSYRYNLQEVVVNAGLDPILAKSLIFQGNSVRGGAVAPGKNIYMKCLGNGKNKALLLTSNVLDKMSILSLKDGEVYEGIVPLVYMHPGVRVYGPSGDITDELLMRDVGSRGVLGIPQCRELDSYLEENYGEEEKIIYYLALMQFHMDKISGLSSRWRVYRELESITALLNRVLHSRVYRDGLMEITEDAQLRPTSKGIEIFNELCRGEFP